MALQETGCRQSVQDYYTKAAQKSGQTIICGAPTPLQRDKRRFWRPDRGTVPGVALQCSEVTRAVAIQPTTQQGMQLWRGGRFVLATVLLGSVRAIVGSVYLPSGDSAEATARRRSCLDLLQIEIESHQQIPMLIGGDWNCPPAQNPCLAALATRGWQTPLHVDTMGHPCETTHLTPHGGNCIDYWVVSPAVGWIAAQTVRELPGHSHRTVSVEVPALAQKTTEVTTLPPVSYKVDKTLHTSCPVLWQAVTQEIRRLLALDHLDLAWRLWESAYHDDLQSRSSSCPSEPPGLTWKMTRQYTARVTLRGEEGEQLKQLARLSRQLLDYGKWGGARVSQRIARGYWLANQSGFALTLSEAMENRLGASEALHKHAQNLQETQKRDRICKWERSLATLKQRPTPILYQWLRGFSPSATSALIGPDGPLETLSDTFRAHRTFWESICCHPQPQEEYQRNDIMRETLKSSELPLEAQDILNAAANIRQGTAPGLDNWPPEAVTAISREAAQALAYLYRHIESCGTWPASLTRVKVALLVKPGTSGSSPSDWRPISVTSVWYRLYGQIRLGCCLRAVLPHLP